MKKNPKKPNQNTHSMCVPVCFFSCDCFFWGGQQQQQQPLSKKHPAGALSALYILLYSISLELVESLVVVFGMPINKK